MPSLVDVIIDEVSENIGRMGRNNFLLKQIIRGGANTEIIRYNEHNLWKLL